MILLFASLGYALILVLHKHWTFLVNFFEKPARQVIVLFNSESAAYDGRICFPKKLSKFVLLAFAYIAWTICAAFDIILDFLISRPKIISQYKNIASYLIYNIINIMIKKYFYLKHKSKFNE